MTVDRWTYYTHLHADEFEIDWIGFYDRLDEMTAATRRRLTHVLDIPYAQHPKQKLDVYLPEGLEPGPVFVFFHGGGFVEGDRCHYGCVADSFAKNGIVTVVAGYRLAPDFHYPSQPKDVQAALAWVYSNIDRHGGNPNRIYLGGHSAGAILTADVALETDWLRARSLPGDLIKGAAPISGPYDARDPAIAAYLAEDCDEATAEKASPLFNVKSPPAHTVIALGSQEPEWTDSNLELAHRIRERGGSSEFLILDGMSHDQTALTLCDSQGLLFRSILGMIADEAEETH